MKKVFIITGTSRGIGKALAKYYLSLGNIIVGCSRSISSLSDEDYLHYQLDVGDEVAVSNMIRTIARSYGRVDVLLNNAGIASMNPLALTPSLTAKRMFSTNFLGTFIFLREVSKTMMRKKKGRIVNFTSVASPLRLEGESIYAASKAAVERFTEIAAKELGNHGVTVNAIGPVPIKTDLIKNVQKQTIKSLIDRQAIPRYGTIKDITHLIDFLIDDKSDFITGQIIYLGGIPF